MPQNKSICSPVIMSTSAGDPHYWKALVGALFKSMDLKAPGQKGECLNHEEKKLGVTIN